MALEVKRKEKLKFGLVILVLAGWYDDDANYEYSEGSDKVQISSWQYIYSIGQRGNKSAKGKVSKGDVVILDKADMRWSRGVKYYRVVSVNGNNSFYANKLYMSCEAQKCKAIS
jgi:hypothetical protein